jgi:hypothetical protein
LTPALWFRHSVRWRSRHFEQDDERVVLNLGLKDAFQVAVQVVAVDRGELDRKVDL